jgi:predicted small metal-binding protein
LLHSEASGPPYQKVKAGIGKELIMARKYIDCRDYPEAAKGCTLAISADTDKEVIEAAAQHANAVHGYKDTPELREQLRSSVKEGSPCP